MVKTHTQPVSPITIEQLEALASQIENDNETEKERLTRLCRAMIRILAVRQPELFLRHATSATDEEGRSDDSFPPSIQYHFDGAPRLIKVRSETTSDKPTSSGFYHDYQIYTNDRGCYVGRDGGFYGCNEHGTAHFGAFAAHPGTCSRDITRDFEPLDPTLDDLREAEAHLRECMAAFLSEVAA